VNRHPLRGRAAIVGFGDCHAARGEAPSAYRLAMLAIARALDDAGVGKDEVDGLLTGRAPLSEERLQWNNVLASYARLTPRYSTEITTHAAGMNLMLRHAALAVTQGLARFVLCVGADALAASPQARQRIGAVDADPEFEQPYEPLIPTLYALVANRLQHEYGITEEDLAAVVVECQRWAVHHPHASRAHLGLVTAAEVMRSPPVAGVLRRWHCAPWGPPGSAGALLVTNAETARALHPRPVYLLGAGECHTHESLTDRMGLRRSALPLGALPNLTTTGGVVAARDAFAEAGIACGDVDVVQTASQFAHVELMALAEMGFVGLREAGAFVRSGVTGPGGALPTNTNGGWLGFGQPGVSCVMDSLGEAVRQLRGRALGLQVPDPVIAVVHANGGVHACHSVSVLGLQP
jgi:acetyl-CoA acetyltransferase